MKRTTHNHNIWFIMVFISASIHGANESNNYESQVQTIKYIISHPGPNQKSEFKKCLKDKDNAKLLNTARHHATLFSNNQTLAHWVVNGGNLKLLECMYELGETASQQITTYIPGNPCNQKALKSTPYLGLCFHMTDLDGELPEKQELYLSLLEQFAERTPAVVVTARHDGMTPAMALASQNSQLKLRALKILLKHNDKAFCGSTSENRCIIGVALKSEETPESIEALRMFLESKKSELENNQQHFENVLLHFHRILSRSQTKPMYLSIVASYMKPLEPSHQASGLAIESAPTATTPTIQPRLYEGLCLCCQNECFCCQRRNPYHPEHTAYWEEYYRYCPNIH